MVKVCTIPQFGQKKNSLEKSENPTDKSNTNVVHNKTPVLLQTAEILIGILPPPPKKKKNNNNNQ